VPQPSNPLKSFNWSKLPECKVQGTIWTDLDDSKLYKQLDLGEVDRLFSAYQKNGIMVSNFICKKNTQRVNIIRI
jgi:dishevelled associated activator of morphogenesis